MLWSKILIPTLKDDPADAEAISHKLMIRAGLIRKLSSGVYSYLPLGLRVLQKVEKIIREEMNQQGALEVLLPALHPAELWEQTGRFTALGEDMISFIDRHGKKVVLGPTHEEIITALVKNEVSSYKQLPLIIYQIQTKFRDEVRPRFGVIRSKEFIMKDAYSFDIDEKALDTSYRKMYEAYCAIFKRCGLPYIAVEADPGIMGGNESCEFMVLAEHGEDIIILCPDCGWASSQAKAECVKPDIAGTPKDDLAALKEVDTPGVSSVEGVSKLLKVAPRDLIKTMVYETSLGVVVVLVRGDHEVNEAKLSRHLKADSLKLAESKVIEKITNGPLGFSGPVGLSGVRIVVDFAIMQGTNFVSGANKKDKHLVNVNPRRDFNVEELADVRYFSQGDVCPVCKKENAKINRAVEVGHVFKLGTKYTQSLSATYLDEQGRQKLIIMGCYGIGVNRIIATAIEQGNDKDGIIWPKEIAPYQIIILPLNMDSAPIRDSAQEIYKELFAAGIEVLLDDRNERAGVKFKDADLLGIPCQVVIGEKSLGRGEIEIKVRKTKEKIVVKKANAAEYLIKTVQSIK